MVFRFRTLSFSSPRRSEISRTRSNREARSMSFELQSDEVRVALPPSRGDEVPVPLTSFTLDELRRATRNFSPSNILQGLTCGLDKVYVGRLDDGSHVAIKRISKLQTNSELHFETERRIGSITPHPNLLRLRGFCISEQEWLLVYPLFKNTLKSCLFRRPSSDTTTEQEFKPLDWPTRKRIALAVAKALAHLHDQHDPAMVHCGVTSSNVLLLNGEFDAVLGGFDSARLMPEGSGEAQSMVTIDFADDSLTRSIVGSHQLIEKCTSKTDVYMYGVLLLRLITGQDLFDFDRHPSLCSLLDWSVRLYEVNNFGSVIDPVLREHYVKEEAEGLTRLALQCVQGNPILRPSMYEVVKTIEKHMTVADMSRSSSCMSNRWSRSDSYSTVYYSFPPSPYPSAIRSN